MCATIARDGELFVLQSRPVTTAPRRGQEAKAASALALIMSTFGAGKADE